MISSILLVFAFVFFAIAATNWIPEPSKTQVIAAGFACGTLSLLVSGWIK
jgi:hypothetical protein